MRQALIGHTGFVGSNLARECAFDFTFNSKNIEDLKGQHFERIVCAGLPAAKWLANQHPTEDRANIRRLVEVLERTTADVFVLISTIDVYPMPVGVDEDYCPAETEVPDAYGRHRLEFENFVRRRFAKSHIVRLPALFGPGLKKNAVFDLIHDNRLEWIHPESSFQWYPTRRLTSDLSLVEKAGLAVVNLATEPLVTGDLQRHFFAAKRLGGKTDSIARYDFRTRHSMLWQHRDGYCMSRTDVLTAMAEYIRDCGIASKCD
jgi:nucleoside-diphosphate-sugar epimerase